MINILIITFLVVAIVICFIMLSMCNVIKDTDIRSEVIRQDLLKNKRMANAEPEEYRCFMCSKKFTDGGTFKVYENKWHCINCYLWILNIKNESFIKKVKAHFLEERKRKKNLKEQVKDERFKGFQVWYVCKYFDTHFEECMGKYENKEDAERTAKWFNDGNKSGLISYEVRFEENDVA